MQPGIPDNYGHQAFCNPVTKKVFGRSKCAFNGMPSTNHQPWKASSGLSYSVNVPVPIYPPEATDQPAYPPNELLSSCSHSTFQSSKLMSNLTGGFQSETTLHSAYSRSLTTGGQPTCFQNRSMQPSPASFRSSCEFVPSQNRPTCWNQDARRTVRNFSPYQNPSSTGMEPSAQSFLVTRHRPPLQKHKMSPRSEQPPSWSDRRTPFAAGQVEHYWNKQAPNYQQMPVHGSFSRRVNQQSSTEHRHHLGPFQNTDTENYKELIGPNIFDAGHQGEVLQRDSLTVPQVATQNHFMKVGHNEAPVSIQGTIAIGSKPYTQIPAPDHLQSGSVLTIDTQRDNGTAFQDHDRDYEFTYRGQNVSGPYSQKFPQYSRKRKAVDVMKFLSELTSRELTALMFAFELMERKKQTAEQVGQLPYAQQNPTKLQSCQFTAQRVSCKDVNIIPQRSVASVNGYEEINESCPLTVLRRLQKEKGGNLQISHANHMSLNTNPTAYSNPMDLVTRDYCTQGKNMNSNVVYPNQGSRQVLAPHVGNSQYFCPMEEQATLSVQVHKENSVCQNDAETSHSNNHCGALGTDCNLKSRSFNCLNYSTKNLEMSSSVNPNYLGPNQLNGRSHHSVQPTDARTLANINQIDTLGMKTNASQHDEQSLKEIEALYNMLQSSHINKTNGHSKRQKVEAPSTTIQLSSSEFDQANAGSFSAVQSSHGNQVTEYMQSEHWPYIKRNISSPSARSYSRASKRQDANVALPLPKTLDEKGSVPLNQFGDKSNSSLMRVLLNKSMDQGNSADFPNLAECKLPCCSSERSGGPQPLCKMDVAPIPQSIMKEQQAGGYPADECTAPSVGSHKTLALVSEELSAGEKAATDMVLFSNAGSNDQKGGLSVPADFPEQGIVRPAPPPELPHGQSGPSVCNTCYMGLNCKTSSGVSARNHEEKMSSASDISDTTNDSKICNSSPERVVEELTSVSNSEEPLVKESDTLEFILRSLGIIPEDSEEECAEENTTVSFPDNLSCTELQQNQDIHLPPPNMVPQSEMPTAVASLDPFSALWRVSTDGSNVASISIKEGQRKPNVPADPLYNDNTDSMAGKLKSDGVNQLSSPCQPNIQVKSDQTTVALRTTEGDLPSKAAGPSNTVTQSAVASVQAGTEDCQKAEENLPDNPASAKIKMQKHTAATNSVQFEDVGLHNGSPPSDIASHHLLSSPVGLAQLTRINTVPSQPVDLGGSYNGQCLRNSSGKIPALSDCCVSNASTVSVVRFKKHVVDWHFDSCKGLTKQLNPVPQKEIMGTLETMGMSNSQAQDSHENILLDSEGSFGNSSNSTQTVLAASPAGAEISSADDALNSSNCIALDPLHAKQDVLPRRVRLHCIVPASGIHSFFHNSSDEFNPLGVTVRQELREEGCLVRKETLSECTAIAAHRNPKTDLPSGIRITFVYSLSEYWEHGTFINSMDIISGSLASTGQELQRCFRKLCSFSTGQMKQKANVINGKGILRALMGTASNLGGSPQRHHPTELPHSQGIVPSTDNSPVHLGDAFSIITNCSESSFHPEVNLGRIPVDDKQASAVTASTDISKLLCGNACCNENSAEDCTNVVDKETSALCCWSSRETMNQNFFSKNEFHSTAEMEMSTESILRFWSPSKDGTEMHSPGQEPEKGLDFEHGIQRIYGGLGIYTAASEEELNKTMHKLSALHHLQFDFTAAVNGSQIQREKSHLNDLYNQCNEAEVIEVEGVSEEHKPISHLSNDEDNMDNWTDTALLKVLLEPCSPKSGLRKRSDQMSSDLDNCIYGNNEVEAGKTEISVPAVRLTERRNSIHDNNELVNQGSSFTRLSPHPFRDEESLNECEPDMDLSSEMRIKVPGDQEFNSVLSEISNSILTSESVGAEGSLEGQSPGTHWKTIKNCDARYLDITGYKQMETSATECSSETSNSRTLSFSRVVSNLQH